MIKYAHDLWNKQDFAVTIVDSRANNLFLNGDSTHHLQKHITYSKNIPHSQFLSPEGHFLSERQISKVFIDNNVDTIPTVVTYGPNAFVVDLALKLVGCERSKVFLGWSEYASVPEIDMEMGGHNKPIDFHFQ